MVSYKKLYPKLIQDLAFFRNNTEKWNNYVNNDLHFAQLKFTPQTTHHIKLLSRLKNYGNEWYLHINERLAEVAGEIRHALYISEKIAINAPTGSGKTTIFLSENNTLQLLGKTLFLVPYTSLLKQIINDYKHRNDIVIYDSSMNKEERGFVLQYAYTNENIRFVIATYDNVNIVKEMDFDNVIVDESHELINALSYRDKALDSIWTYLSDNSRHKKTILISATTNFLLKNLNFNILNIKREVYNYTVNIVTYKEKLLYSLAFFLQNTYTKGKKRVIELNNIERIKQLKDYIKALNPELTIELIDSKSQRIEESQEYTSLINNSLMTCDILICTKFIEAGINIKNTDIQDVIYVFDQTKNIDSFKQFCGRFREMKKLNTIIFTKEKAKTKYFETLESIYKRYKVSNENYAKDCDLEYANGKNPTNLNLELWLEEILNELTENPNNNLIKFYCVDFNKIIQRHFVKEHYLLWLTINSYNNNLTYDMFLQELTKGSNEYLAGKIINLDKVDSENTMFFDIQNQQYKAYKEYAMQMVVNFSESSNQNFVDLAYKAFKQDKANLLDLAFTLKTQPAKSKENEAVVEFWRENSEIIKTTKILDNLMIDVIRLGRFVKDSQNTVKEVLDFKGKLKEYKLEINQFENLFAYYAYSQKEFAAYLEKNKKENQNLIKISKNKDFVKVLQDFIISKDYVVRYNDLVHNKELNKIFGKSTEIERWTKILFMVQTDRNTKQKFKFWKCTPRPFYDLKTMQDVLGFALEKKKN